MKMDVKNIITQIDALLSEFDRAKSASRYDDLSGGLPTNEMISIYTRMDSKDNPS